MVASLREGGFISVPLWQFNVDPDVAATVAEAFHGIAADHQDIRQYPNGAVGENIIGKVRAIILPFSRIGTVPSPDINAR